MSEDKKPASTNDLSTIDYSNAFPLLPLRDVVVFPHMVIPLFVGREKSIVALEHAMENGKYIALVAQRNAALEDPAFDDIHEIGVLANILQLLKLPDGTVKVLVEGKQRISFEKVYEEDCFFTLAKPIVTQQAQESESKVAIKTVISEFEKYSKINAKVAPEALSQLSNIEELDHLLDSIASFLELKLEDKQYLLEADNINERLDHILSFMDSELDMHRVEKKIRGRVKKQMEKSQREYYLNEQMKAIQTELGESEEGQSELDEIQAKVDAAGMPKEAKEKVNAELKKLKMMSPMSAEAAVVRNYIDWVVQVPWSKRSRVRSDIDAAQEVLDADHFGLEKVKERILEYLAVQKRLKKMKGPILCLVGPPGVGKTSLGKSIAKATNRKFIRMSLGGVRDEAEIRGHRRTYIGSMPGKIIQNMSKVKAKNPLFLLDEIDKMAADFRGDPASAMLEVLDPEQNSAFYDNFLELGYDLSKVMFIATSNSLSTIQPALRDRMEIINVSGYTIEEKVEIAKRHLLPKQLEEHGLTEKNLKIAKPQLEKIVEGYTRESGVRTLEKQIAKMVRYAAMKIAMEESYEPKISSEIIVEVLGAPKLERDKYENNDVAGVVTGLAWTRVGGDILFIESALSKGKGVLTMTGNLGKVMKESATIALEYIKSNSSKLGIAANVFDKYNVHIHVPEGATPKDGPSAGITMLTSLVSLFTQRKVKKSLAMTGEITLRGKVLPVGGIKEKILAAKRARIKEILLCEDNRRDIEEIKPEYLKGLTFHYVKEMSDVLDLAITKQKVKNAKKF